MIVVYKFVGIMCQGQALIFARLESAVLCEKIDVSSFAHLFFYEFCNKVETYLFRALSRLLVRIKLHCVYFFLDDLRKQVEILFQTELCELLSNVVRNFLHDSVRALLFCL